MTEYKKSYLGFVIWIVAYCVCCFSVCFIGINDVQIIIAIVDNFTTISLFLLTAIIYKTEAIYWYNGTEFEEAREAGSERRKRFAAAHMYRFGLFAAAFLVYSIISVFVGIPFGVDITIASVGIIAVAISTVNIKL
ncbi:MAG: hypothetical protein E7265_09620 [Lachnospiraceae bacterium]|nr:hypothetical protein [Lachnospiraceae bacterium]